ncbi:S8 family peptidase [Auritidibacter ignavus]|uniref:S8 family peptidase n=1 Tax=Auritidibacter ignavus TaxID=678932 RepID=A0AAJ6DBL0_9MICC|nr:S8 family peptidase [Auritidibacter ignavus]WGH92519.1 S8 family peptidase [Auritidibacter ignavus]WHS29102.1 S8 family peptidase [Auritidibacter ignavus]
MPRVSKPSAGRQGERLTPQFGELRAAFNAGRAHLSVDTPDEVDPALVVVFDLAGSIKDFRNAIDQIDGLEFLSELIGDQSDPDDDFHMADSENGRTDKPVQHSLYLMMSNAKAIDELLRLFTAWQADPSASFAYGLGKFKTAFQQLTAIRRWGPEDRIRETGLREQWQEKLDVVGQSVSTVMVEVELWYRRDAAKRATAQAHVEQVISDSGGRVLDRSQIGEISYHALLAELPIQQVHSLLADGAESIRLLTTDEIMFVNPFTPMSVAPPTTEPVSELHMLSGERTEGLPRVALLDGLPFSNHDALAGRLVVDDPDGLGENYPLAARHHGTAMASLIIHGDLSTEGEPLDRPLYVRPIMQPHEFVAGHEQILPDRLLTDLLHRAVKRIVEGEAGRDPVAQSVRIINLSIGAQARALVHRMSPVGRLLDWLAHSYNLLFIVSAGNHLGPLTIPADAISNADSARSAALRSVYDAALLRGILPPGDALNALTIGATHSDGLGDIEVPDTAWDITHQNGPAYYGATGPGVDRSVKPDLHHIGGRALYARPLTPPAGQETVAVELAQTATTGPGLQVAAPGRAGATDNTVFTVGTSNATALVTREASRLYDILEAGAGDPEDTPLPDPQYHPLLVRALLAHASSWGEWEARLRSELGLTNQQARRRLTAHLGYGRLDTDRLGTAATNRAVLVGGVLIARDQRHTYELPLPPSLRARAEWHRFTITLAYMVPTFGQLNRYRGAKVYFATPNTQLASGDRIDAEHNSVRRGSLQHEIVQGTRAMVFGDDASFPIHVECMDDAQRLRAGKTVRYAIVVSVETAEQTSTTIHDEVRARLRQQTRDRARGRVQS